MHHEAHRNSISKKEQDRRVKIVQNNKCILNVNFQQCKYNQFYDQIMRVG